MSRAVAVVVAAFLVGPVARMSALGASDPEKRPETAPRAAIVAGHASFHASLFRISQKSPLFREAIDALRRASGRILIVTPDQFTSMRLGPSEVASEVVDASLLAETAPMIDVDAQVRAVVVVINLGLIERAHASNGSLAGELQSDLDRIIIHEVYGHAIPYLQAGDLSGRCADPQPGQRPRDACSIQRENEVREELGLGRRVDSGLEGLTLSRRMRH